MKALLIAGLLAGLASEPLLANCVEPPPPAHLPNGATASRDEMLSALQTVAAYNQAVTAYVDCMDQTNGEPARREGAVERLHKIADKFNAELRVFKARSGG